MFFVRDSDKVDFCILLQADDVDPCKPFQCSLLKEFNDIMTDSVTSFSHTTEWWSQRISLDSRMKVQLSE